MLAVAITATAQDELPGPNSLPAGSNFFSQELPSYDEKPLLMEQRSVADSLQHKVVPVPAAKSKATDPKKIEAEGDPLNFNFLYYIIQKFKASELMME